MAPIGRADTISLTGSVRAAWSDASDGDLRPGDLPPADHGLAVGSALTGFADRMAQASGAEFDQVAWVTQVHGSGVVVVDRSPSSGPHRASCHNLGAADALVATDTHSALAVLTADCAPLALASPEGVFAAVHAGWRGLVAGVVEAAVAAMADCGATEIVGVLGPCIHRCCYEFGADDLDVVADCYGGTVRSETTDGRPALDLVAGVRLAMDGSDARLLDVVDACTACGGGEFSHRARRDTCRQALLVWSVPGTGSR